MKQFYIRLNTIQDVRNFVNAVCASDREIDLTSGRYIVDAKSIMGIFSLDLLSPIQVTVHGDGPVSPALMDSLKPFMCDAPAK